MSAEPAASDFSLRIVCSLARWIEDKRGRQALVDVAARAGIRAEDFDGSTRWASHAQVELFLAGGRELAGDEDTFRTALTYRFEEGYGAFRYMVWAVSQERIAQLAIAMTNKVITNVSHFDILYSTPTKFGFRYSSTRPESHLMCMSRKAAWMAMPTLRGLPRAELVEGACIANGDACCEYHLRWFDERGLAPILIGLAVGFALVIVAALFAPLRPSAIALPLLGAALGHVRELRRVDKCNVRHANGIGAALRTLGEAEAETRSEIVALQQRQQGWSSRMEHEANDRNDTLERVVAGLDGLQQTRVSSIRGFSHDLRNPLFVVRANTRILRERALGGDTEEILEDMDAASLQIESMLGKLMELATAETALVKLAPRSVDVGPLAAMLRRRLKALVHGRGIEVNVTHARCAPAAITVDPLVFDRVVDNLLTNAAKYTDRGRIDLVIGGPRPMTQDGAGSLTLELSDTGRGIPASEIERIFRPRPAAEPTSPNSYGIGLSSAVRLLGQIGGRLEVTSKRGVGSTFTAYFPAAPAQQRRAIGDEGLESVISRVVEVRKAS
ncbi:MAG: sensor histidine kinase [Myxococcaceae bacterium]|nr:sensor histidine kinase [Myxococcaceae bacterium]